MVEIDRPPRAKMTLARALKQAAKAGARRVTYEGVIFELSEGCKDAGKEAMPTPLEAWKVKRNARQA